MANIDAFAHTAAYYESDANACPCGPDEASSTSDVAAPSAVFEGDLEDIYFDVAAANGPDYHVTPTGDWLPVSGDEALRQSLLRDYITNPGEWVTNPQYGAGGRAFLKAKATKAARDAFAQRLRLRTLADSRVESVSDVQVEKFAEGGFKFKVTYWRKGRAKDDRADTVSFEAPG